MAPPALAGWGRGWAAPVAAMVIRSADASQVPARPFAARRHASSGTPFSADRNARRARRDFADDRGLRKALGVKQREDIGDSLGCTRHQQTAGGLRIGKHRALRIADV